MKSTTTGTVAMTKPMNLTLKITQAAIDDAEQRNSAKCMIACALRGKGFKSVHVTAETVRFNDDLKRYIYPTPIRAAAALLKFDKNRSSVKPFELRLSGNVGFARPIEQRPERIGVSHIKRRKQRQLAPLPKRSIRRFNGVRAIDVAA